jgi:hypothetical protein
MKYIQCVKITLCAFIVFFVLNSSCFSQFNTRYNSFQESEYFKNKSKIDFQSVDSIEILNFKPSYINLYGIDNYTKFEMFNPVVLFQDSFHYQENHDTIWNLNKINDIYPLSIIKMDTNDVNGYIIYRDSEYDDFLFSGDGYWISLKKGGKWTKYFTGLSEMNPLYLKWNSKFVLQNEKHKIKIESSLMRMTEPTRLPIADPEFEIIRDGLVTEFIIDSIIKDSDNDGLTDIVESKMMLNPYLSDSDADGINDYLDLNPRFKNMHTDNHNLYEYLLREINTQYDRGVLDTFIRSDTKYPMSYFQNGLSTYVIVTDNEELQSISPKDYRIIFMTSLEFEIHKKQFFNSFNRIFVSPLFKIDNRKSKFKLHIDLMSWGTIYLLKKKKNGWRIKLLGSWIS